MVAVNSRRDVMSQFTSYMDGVQGGDPPFWGTPKPHKEGEGPGWTLPCVCVNSPFLFY